MSTRIELEARLSGLQIRSDIMSKSVNELDETLVQLKSRLLDINERILAVRKQLADLCD